MAKEKAPKGASGVEIYTTSIRISEKLIERVRERSNETGASVNSTICDLIDLGLKVCDSKFIIHLQE